MLKSHLAWYQLPVRCYSSTKNHWCHVLYWVFLFNQSVNQFSADKYHVINKNNCFAENVTTKTTGMHCKKNYTLSQRWASQSTWNYKLSAPFKEWINQLTKLFSSVKTTYENTARPTFWVHSMSDIFTEEFLKSLRVCERSSVETERAALPQHLVAF